MNGGVFRVSETRNAKTREVQTHSIGIQNVSMP